LSINEADLSKIRVKGLLPLDGDLQYVLVFPKVGNPVFGIGTAKITVANEDHFRAKNCGNELLRAHRDTLREAKA